METSKQTSSLQRSAAAADIEETLQPSPTQHMDIDTGSLEPQDVDSTNDMDIDDHALYSREESQDSEQERHAVLVHKLNKVFVWHTDALSDVANLDIKVAEVEQLHKEILVSTLSRQIKDSSEQLLSTIRKLRHSYHALHSSEALHDEDEEEVPPIIASEEEEIQEYTNDDADTDSACDVEDEEEPAQDDATDDIKVASSNNDVHPFTQLSLKDFQAEGSLTIQENCFHFKSHKISSQADIRKLCSHADLFLVASFETNFRRSLAKLCRSAISRDNTPKFHFIMVLLCGANSFITNPPLSEDLILFSEDGREMQVQFVKYAYGQRQALVSEFADVWCFNENDGYPFKNVSVLSLLPKKMLL